MSKAEEYLKEKRRVEEERRQLSEGLQKPTFSDPTGKSRAALAWVHDDGSLGMSGGPHISAEHACELAEWILETFR